MATKPTPQQAVDLEFRKAVPPEPKRYAQCRNCKHLVYDDGDRMDLRGQLVFIKENTRCRLHGIAVRLGTVCKTHEFAYPDRGDR